MKKLLVVIMLVFLAGCESPTETYVKEWDSCDIYLWKSNDSYQYETIENVSLETTDIGVILTYKQDGMMWERLVQQEYIKQCVREK